MTNAGEDVVVYGTLWSAGIMRISVVNRIGFGCEFKQKFGQSRIKISGMIRRN